MPSSSNRDSTRSARRGVTTFLGSGVGGGTSACSVRGVETNAAAVVVAAGSTLSLEGTEAGACEGKTVGGSGCIGEDDPTIGASGEWS